eukprot:365023-Chlamydomonas_euryale.AAC.28
MGVGGGGTHGCGSFATAMMCARGVWGGVGGSPCSICTALASLLHTCHPAAAQVMDNLWRAGSKGRFGFTPQREIYNQQQKQWARFFKVSLHRFSSTIIPLPPPPDSPPQC